MPSPKQLISASQNKGSIRRAFLFAAALSAIGILGDALRDKQPENEPATAITYALELSI